MGIPARIVDERLVRVLVSDGKGGFLPGSARLQGMVALDEPTLTYYQRIDINGVGDRPEPTEHPVAGHTR
jgi:hypothetical protein